MTKDITAELEDAERARKAGREGRARVCARRAAGMAARDFLTRHGISLRDASAYAALQALLVFPGLQEDLRPAVQHLTMRLTEEFALPMEADLIADARKLIGGLSMTTITTEITLYGTSWCGGSRRARQLLEKSQIPYLWVDIEHDEKSAQVVEGLTGGYRSVPTIVWPDGSCMVEPTMQELAKKLGISLE